MSIVLRALHVFFAALVLLCGTKLWAQNRSTAEIIGSVTDPSGAVVPSAKVTVENTATGKLVQLKTNESGYYTAPLLQPGNYTVKFEQDGFKTTQRTNINLVLDQTARIDGKLEIGQGQALVEVQATTPLVDSDNSERGSNFSTELTQNLPLVGRDPSALAVLSAGTSTVQGANDANPDAGRRNVNGNRAFSIQATINGGSALLPNSNNFQAFIPPLGAVSEFAVVQDNFSAQFGSGTSVLNMLTKSGSNQWHGSAFDFVQNDVLNARYTFDAEKQKLRYNQFGGTIGGPIRKDKLFFFFSYQNTLTPSVGSSFVTVPTQAAIGGDLSAYLAPGQTIRDPRTGQAFAGNRVPTTRIDPVAANAATYWPQPNRPGLTNNYYSLQPTNPQSPYYDGKVDWNISPLHALSVTTHVFDFSRSYTGQIPGPACFGGEYCGEETTLDQQHQISERWTISPTAINEFHANFVRETYGVTTPNFNGGYAERIGLNANVPGYYFPAFNISGQLPTSLGAGQHYAGAQNNFIYDDTISWIAGRHSLKFGGQFMKSQFNPRGDWNPGTFGFSGQFSGVGFADFLLGVPNTYDLQAQPQSIGARRTAAAAFITDSWRVSQNLTVNMGMRYQYEGGFYESNNRLSNFDPYAVNPATQTLGALTFANSSNRNLQQDHALLFAPRIGFAYSAPKGFVVRSAYGIFYAQNGAQQNFNTALPGFGITQSLQTTDQQTPVFQLSSGPPPFIIPDGSNRTGAISNNSNISYWPYYAAQPSVQQWQFSIQKQLGAQTVLEAAYVGNKGTHLLFPRDYNQVPANRLAPGDAQPRRPFPQFRLITSRLNDGDSTYHALQIKVNRRMSNGLTFLANYTYSKSMDNSSYDTTSGQGTQYQIAANPSLNRGPSQFDQTHRAVISYVYELPAGRGRKWLNDSALVDSFLGGWRTSGSFIVATGSPFNVYVGGNGIANTNALSGFLYADRRADGNLPDDQRSTARWFDTNAFVDPPLYRFGNAGRGILRGPNSWNFDFGLMKDFSLPVKWEKTSLQLRLDAFNIFNHANLGLPNATTGSTAFGTITSASNPRRLQIGLQLLF